MRRRGWVRGVAWAGFAGSLLLVGGWGDGPAEIHTTPVSVTTTTTTGRMVDLDTYGPNAIGNPAAFVVEVPNADIGHAPGDLVVDCDNPRIWCDDEGA